jgi:protein-S-isoprenylcysteine O-methyltransferase Ste14
MGKGLLALRAALYASVFVALWTFLAIWARRADTRLGVLLPAWTPPLGAVLALPGAVLVASCVVAFAVFGHGTPAPFDAPRQFVSRGPYRVVRNPMYLGALMVLLGAALWLRSISLVLLGLVFVLAAHAFVTLFEEPRLERRFGASYAAYKREVRRWLPWPRPSRSSPQHSGPD